MPSTIFHSTYEGLPPFYLDAARAGTFPLLYSFGEQQALWDMLTHATDNTTTTGLNVNVYTDWWLNTLTQEQRESFGSVAWMRCPTRRGSGPLTAEGTHQPGPMGDYAIVLYVTDTPPAAGKSTSTAAPAGKWYEYGSTRAKFMAQDTANQNFAALFDTPTRGHWPSIRITLTATLGCRPIRSPLGQTEQRIRSSSAKNTFP